MSEDPGEPATRDHPDEPETRSAGAVGTLADLFVYAPIGLVSEAGRIWPEVVAAGRGHVETAIALQAGAVEQAKGWLLSRAGSGRSEASAALRGLGLTRGSDPSPRATRVEPATGSGPAVSDEAPEEAAVDPEASSGPLAIPDYDLLSASQVVPRLDALSPDELAEVRAHEEANRSRRTILSKIAPLQAG